MPNQQPAPSIQNHFQAGLKTEFTGLNFPENAATSTSNCIYTIVGDVTRRGGINYEANSVTQNIDTPSVAHASYKWTNVGGDGQTKVLVKQVGSILFFFLQTNATTASPLSTTLLTSNINISNFQVMGNTNNVAVTECQFTDGNGFLIVFHKDCDPFFCTFNSNNQTVTANIIKIQIRDFVGIPEPNVLNTFRPPTLVPEHQYNLINQGWSSGTPWTAVIYNNGTIQPGPTNTFGFPQGTFNLSTQSTITIPIVSQSNTTSITNGSVIQLTFDNPFVPGAPQGNAGGVSIMSIFVTSYVTPFTSLTGTILSATINVGSGSDTSVPPFIFSYDFDRNNGINDMVKFDNLIKHSDSDYITATLTNVGFVQNWFTQVGNFPSNSDVWWLYKNTSDIFDPQHLLPNVQQAFGPAPKGFFIMNAFDQQRTLLSSVAGLTDISTTTRPSTGCWFQGRVFYSGVNASQLATGDEPYTTWTENIYFSKIIETSSDFGLCFQANDPTSQNLFSILPSDGGVISIQGSGAIRKLFPLRYGLLVFAANGVWFISGSQGVGFAANDYTVIKISSIQTTSNTSFIDVLGYPFFWNAEGIYRVVPSQQAGSAHSPDIQLDVQNLCIGTILTFYNTIPQVSTQFARGDYDSINYIIQWLFRSTNESGIANRYNYDSMLCFNTVTNAFYTYSLPTTSNSSICDIKYIQNPGGSGLPLPIFKYITQITSAGITFSEENDFTNFVDFISENGTGFNYISTFTAGYVLPGQGTRKIQVPYLYLFFREPSNSACEAQGVWDYAINRSSGRWSSLQLITNNINPANFNMLYRRIRLRGRGMAFQLQIKSVQGQPFDIMGWSVWDVINPGV